MNIDGKQAVIERGSVLTKAQLKIELIVEFVIGAILLVASLLLSIFGPSIQVSREYWVEDHINTHNYVEHETIPSYLAAVFVAITLIPPFVTELASKDSCKHNGKRAGMYLLSCFVSFTGCFFIVESLKILVARPRPDFYTRCGLDDTITSGFYDTSTCTVTDEEMWKDARVSFPSAHAAYTAFGSAVCSFYIMLVLELNTKRGRANLFFAKCALCFLPFVFSIVTAVSRTFDYRHFPSDVIFGLALGTLFGYIGVFVFRLYLQHWNGSTIPRLEPMSCYDVNESNKAFKVAETSDTTS